MKSISRREFARHSALATTDLNLARPFSGLSASKAPEKADPSVLEEQICHTVVTLTHEVLNPVDETARFSTNKSALQELAAIQNLTPIPGIF